MLVVAVDEFVERGMLTPMVAIELAVDDTRSKAPSWVQAAACEVDPDQLGDKQGQTDSDRRNEGAFMLLRGKHENGKDQFGGKQHLNKETLNDRRAAAEGCLYRERAGKHACD